MNKKMILGLIAGGAFVVLGTVAQYNLSASPREEKAVYEYSQVENEQLQTVKEQIKEEEERTRMIEIAKEKGRLAKVEGERLAKKKAEEEEAARLAAEKEAARIAEEARLAEEAEIARIEEERLAAIEEEEIAYQAAQVAQEEVTYSNTPKADVYKEPVQEVAPARTDGFNFNGYHYDIASFSGSGAVPQWTPYIYQWTSKPNHYLVERMSDAGSAIRILGMGGVVVLNGQSYVVTNIMSGLENDLNTSDLVFESSSSITIQTCDAAIGSNGQSLLTLWFLDAI